MSTPASARKSAHPSAAFPGFRRTWAGPESRQRASDLVVVSHGHLDHIGGLVSESGALAFPKAQFVFVDTEWNYWTGSRFESEVESSPLPEAFKTGTIGGGTREPARRSADRSRFVKQGGEITSGVRDVAAPGRFAVDAAILFASGREQFTHMGDIAHNPVTKPAAPRAGRRSSMMRSPARAIKSRQAVLDRVATDRAIGHGLSSPVPWRSATSSDTHEAYRWESV